MVAERLLHMEEDVARWATVYLRKILQRLESPSLQLVRTLCGDRQINSPDASSQTVARFILGPFGRTNLKKSALVQQKAHMTPGRPSDDADPLTKLCFPDLEEKAPPVSPPGPMPPPDGDVACTAAGAVAQCVVDTHDDEEHETEPTWLQETPGEEALHPIRAIFIKRIDSLNEV